MITFKLFIQAELLCTNNCLFRWVTENLGPLTHSRQTMSQCRHNARAEQQVLTSTLTAYGLLSRRRANASHARSNYTIAIVKEPIAIKPLLQPNFYVAGSAELQIMHHDLIEDSFPL